MKLSEEQAARLAATHLGEADWQVAPFGAGKFSETFSVRCGRRRYVLRVGPSDDVLQLFYEYRMMRQEPAIHQRLLAETAVPVPPIVAHDFSRRGLDRDYLIMPELPGRPLGRASLSAAAQQKAYEQWGRCVAEIHSLLAPCGQFGYLGAHRCMEPQPSWPKAFATMYRKELDDVVRCGVYDAATAERAFGLLRQNLDAFEPCRQSHLLHGDLWVTNLLVARDGTVTGLLDFDRACWGDVEWDLAIAEYCGVTTPSFWRGYGRTVQTHTGAAAVRRMFYLLYEHQKYIVISISARRNDPARAHRYAEQSLAVMERFRRTGTPGF